MLEPNFYFVILQILFLFFSFKVFFQLAKTLFWRILIGLCFSRAVKHNYMLDFKFAEKLCKVMGELPFHVTNPTRYLTRECSIFRLKMSSINHCIALISSIYHCRIHLHCKMNLVFTRESDHDLWITLVNRFISYF